MDTKNYSEEIFENLKHINEFGQEFWYARELQSALEYSQWRRFSDAIERAKTACEKSGHKVEEHFAGAGKSLAMPKGGERIIEDFALSRYACYLIVMNGDPRKEIIALGQTYFAVKTRQQELIEDYERLSEEQKRIAIRNEMKRHNSALADAAHGAGVQLKMNTRINRLAIEVAPKAFRNEVEECSDSGTTEMNCPLFFGQFLCYHICQSDFNWSPIF